MSRKIPWNSLRYKIIIATLAVEVSMLSFLVWNSTRLTNQHLVSQTEHHIKELRPLLNASLSAPLLQEDLATLNEVLGQIINDKNIKYIAVYNSQDQLVANKGNKPDSASFEKSLSTHLKNNSSFELYYTKIRLFLSSLEVGYVNVGIDTRHILEAVSAVKHQGIIISFIEVILSAALLFVIGITLTTNLKTLTMAVHELPKHTHKAEVKIDSKDEVGDLASAFNSMSRELADKEEQRKQAEEEIFRLNLQLEKKVLERTAQLKASNEELTAFSHSVSHDLRAPLRRINSFSHILMEENKDMFDESATRLLSRISWNASHMGKLIDDMIHLAQTSQYEVERTECDASTIATQIIERLQQDNPQRQVDIVIAKHINCLADKRLLSIVLENLLGNAWKYTLTRDKPCIEFSSLIEDDKTIYFIRDNGVGFEMEYAEKIFDTFSRLHTQDEFEGTGIGLATVHRAVNKHGGRIWASAEIDRGATFYFTLD